MRAVFSGEESRVIPVEISYDFFFPYPAFKKDKKGIVPQVFRLPSIGSYYVIHRGKVPRRKGENKKNQNDTVTGGVVTAGPCVHYPCIIRYLQVEQL